MVNVKGIERLRPAILVVLRTTIDGAVQYRRKDIEADHEEEGGKRVAKWETTRVIRDAEEFAEATKVRAAIRNGVASACSVTSAFGLMCPVANADKLDAALREARARTIEFNARARTCSVTLSALRGEISPTDAESARAVVSEVSRMIAAMESGIRKASPAEIRKAADEARALAAVLSDSGRSKVDAAIKEARQAARDLVRRVQKDGEKAAKVVKTLQTAALVDARRTFLDLDSGLGTAGIQSLTPVVGGIDLPVSEV